MTGHIFNIQKNGTLIEMNEEPFENEDIFQTLLQDYPNLLAGDQINSDNPRRWLLVRREMGIPDEESGSDRWSLDHLFLDQDAIPTLVEVKRSTDTRIRREVVGQVLDYAANAVVHWPIEKLMAEFEKQCELDNVASNQRLDEFLSEERETDAFWQTVKTNLQAGKIRMLFVADAIPSELRRIIEFLNAQMDPAEVLGVEIKHFVGADMKTLVPRIIGQSAEAEIRKQTPGRKAPLTITELQAIADQKDVGKLFQLLVKNLEPLFEKTFTSRTTIGFYGSIEGLKTRGVVISLNPFESIAEKGVRFEVHVDRCAEFFQIDRASILDALPPCEFETVNPEWTGETQGGYASEELGLNDLISLMKRSKEGNRG